MISEIEQQTLDIDWFFTDGIGIGFVASGGGKLPKSISTSDAINIKLSIFFRNLPNKCLPLINLGLSKYIEKDNLDMYLSDFKFMSEKGLYVFDKTILNSFEDLNYHLVAKPSNPLLYESLPFEIKEFLINTNFKNNLSKTLNIKIDEFN